MFIATIYNPSEAENSITGEHAIHSDLERLKAIVEDHVDQKNADMNSYISTWDIHNGTYYYAPVDEEYFTYVWAKIARINEGEIQRFTEYGS